ncbi:hypothetical protein [uncultured Parasphingorhabdus sp.]|uniref:hypothetical protein n=1 Tax=uncultured Parasphingorhabdus sp. TaxID=2709694 RepID=UPI0030D7F144|tara:strand:+ start:30289 stop:30567 length:279 start_codon:yes stop_codon:yes gene_type:complete
MDFPILIPILGISCGMLAIIGGVFVKPWIKYKQEQLKVQTQMTAEKAAQYAAHTELLEQRVRVLERIVTDKGMDISQQIENLRDPGETKELN